MVMEIKSLAQFNELINGPKPVVIDFWAPWCGPCRFISPIFEKHSEDPALSDKIVFCKVDVDEVPDVSQEVGIRAMPTFMVFRDGKKVKDLVGANQEGLQELVQTASAL